MTTILFPHEPSEFHTFYSKPYKKPTKQDTKTKPSKPLLFLDVDDTILAECLPGAGFDLRPGVVTQISVLTKLFDCHWLTHRKKKDLDTLWELLFADQLVRNVSYANWRTIDEHNKAPYVLNGNRNFYWTEDPLSTGSLKGLQEAGLMDRYIPVEPKGLWGFTRSLRVLFERAGIKDSHIKKVNGNPKWFVEPLTKDYFDFTYYE